MKTYETNGATVQEYDKTDALIGCRVSRNGVVVDLDNDSNEGKYGDYDSSDPTDEPLLRFTVLVARLPVCPECKATEEHAESCYHSDCDEDDAAVHRCADVSVPDASYCTGISVNTPADQIVSAALLILGNVESEVLAGNRVKKLCEGLSWLGTTRLPLQA
jgi:hypothetical protein